MCSFTKVFQLSLLRNENVISCKTLDKKGTQVAGPARDKIYSKTWVTSKDRSACICTQYDKDSPLFLFR